MLKKRRWMPIAILVLLLQILVEGAAVYYVLKLNMLPALYTFIFLAAVILTIFLTAALMFAGINKKPSIGRRVRRIIAIVLAIALGLGSVAAAYMANELGTTVSKVTEKDDTTSAVVGVYVMKNDNAKSIEDAKDYTFGVMREFDSANTEAAVSKLSEELGKEISTTEFASVTDTAHGLYESEVGAMLINEEYISLLTDTEDYQDFESETRLLYEITVKQSDLANSSSTDSSDDEESTDTSSVENAVSDVTAKPFLIYLSGSDTRSQVLDTSRSDTNILMAVNPETKQILLLNTPRDYYIANPAGGGALDKLTHCGLYGIDNSIKALEDLYDTDVNYYAQINFTGFEKLIDAIGGITVNVPEDFTAGGYTFTKGSNTLDGEQALVFARERYSFASGDNQRGKDQMEVIRATIEKITTGTTILTHYSEIMDSLQDMFVTSMDNDEISSLVRMQLADGASWDVCQFAVTGTGGSEYTYSMPNAKAYVMYPNDTQVEAGKAALEKILSGEKLTDEDLAESA